MVRASPTLPSVTRTGPTLLGPTLLGTSRPGSGLPLLSHPSLRRAGPGRRPWPSVGVIAESLRAVVDLALPLVCASCARPGVACCPDCLAACGWPGGEPLVRSPRPRPDGLPTTWAAGAYEGELRRLLVAYKDGDRRDLAEPLARLLRPVLRAAAQDVAQAVTDRGAGEHTLLVVPVPSSAAARRRRGDAPLADVVATAVAPGARRRPPELLRVRRRVADQAGLDAAARAGNLAGAFAATRAGESLLPGRTCLLVDDVLTTGATLVEAARAVRAAGGRPVVAAVLAATPRRGRRRPSPREGRGQAAGEPPNLSLVSKDPQSFGQAAHQATFGGGRRLPLVHEAPGSAIGPDVDRRRARERPTDRDAGRGHPARLLAGLAPESVSERSVHGRR